MSQPVSAEHGLLQMAARCEVAEAERDRLAEENRALRDLAEWALRMIDGHIADLAGLRESMADQANKIALARLTAPEDTP
jgi:hypothetical protein